MIKIVLNNQKIELRPFYFSEETESETKQSRTFTTNVFEQSEFTLYPNPAKNFVTLDYTILEQGKEKSVLLVNSDGKLIQIINLVNSRDQVVIKLDNLAQGEYICFILVNGKSIGSKKIQVIK